MEIPKWKFPSYKNKKLRFSNLKIGVFLDPIIGIWNLSIGI